MEKNIFVLHSLKKTIHPSSSPCCFSSLPSAQGLLDSLILIPSTTGIKRSFFLQLSES